MNLQEQMNSMIASMTPSGNQQAVEQPQQVEINQPLEEPQPQIEQQELQETVEEDTYIDEAPSPKEINFKRLKEKNKELQERAYLAELERRELARQLEEERRAKQQVVTEPQEDEEEQDDDAYSDKRFVKKIVKRRIDENTKKLEERLIKAEKSLIESRVERMFPDFNNIVNEENLHKLAQLYPHDVTNLSYSPNYESRLIGAYNLITKYGILDHVKEIKEVEQNKQRIQKNAMKPKSAATIAAGGSSSALTKAATYEQELTPEYKAALYADMKRKQKEAGF